MNTLVIAILFYAGAAGLVIAGALCLWRSSALTRIGGTRYERRRIRKVVGQVLICSAVLPLGLGVTNEFFSSTVSETDTISTGTASLSAPANPPPVVLSPSDVSPAPASVAPTVAPAQALLEQGVQLLQQKQYAAALDKVEQGIKIDPRNPKAYELHGNIYLQQGEFDLAEKDYQAALRLEPGDATIQFNAAEIEFMGKRYRVAREAFAPLQQDSDVGDLARYKVFLCDLFGGHEDEADKELDAFNKAGENASYYFANAAWSLSHNKLDDARGWLTSAANIYPAPKFKLYSASLVELGYPGRLNMQEPASP